ncbi:hypothetical protein [Mycobacterium sp. OTB74]|jgi:hypothetical protein|uniref:hypothetical protein n=1 Tax=Mycobacterium sp. OTB74 TaxID=1853452 RepID=UPI00247420AD|nr:hypothetical protein [Mycobacterium sp. OTB74]MDH6243206.1 hypothetical protein [Mycobacterium sp. OTB74]
MKKSAAAFLVFLATAAAPVAISPAAHADVCGDMGGRHVSVGGCTDIARDAAVGAAAAGIATAEPMDAEAQAAAGRPPCYTPAGVPYYTPGDLPC